MPCYANPQNLNRFSYVINNPLRYTDPTGHAQQIDNGGGVPQKPCPSCAKVVQEKIRKYRESHKPVQSSTYTKADLLAQNAGKGGSGGGGSKPDLSPLPMQNDDPPECPLSGCVPLYEGELSSEMIGNLETATINFQSTLNWTAFSVAGAAIVIAALYPPSTPIMAVPALGGLYLGQVESAELSSLISYLDDMQSAAANSPSGSVTVHVFQDSDHHAPLLSLDYGGANTVYTAETIYTTEFLALLVYAGP